MSVSRILVSSGPGPLDDVGAQTREALRRIEIAHNQAEIRPASTMVEVDALVAPELLVEIEADGYSPDDPAADGKVPSADGR
jgi:hypothetical protein